MYGLHRNAKPSSNTSPLCGYLKSRKVSGLIHSFGVGKPASPRTWMPITRARCATLTHPEDHVSIRDSSNDWTAFLCSLVAIPDPCFQWFSTSVVRFLSGQ